MNGFTKLFGSIVTSTIWQESPETKVVWVTMLALVDAEGFVDTTIPGLANIANISIEETREAIAKFEAPDPDSRTTDHEGRRISKVEGGWHLINHGKYRLKGRHEVASFKITGYVYYVECNGKIKIGFSKNPWARLSDLRVAAPKAKLLAVEKGTLQLEKDRHLQFADLREEGEWFRRGKKITEHIANLPKSTQKTPCSKRVATRSYVYTDTDTDTEAEAEAEADKQHRSKNYSFDLFWSEFPRKVGKKKCQGIWSRLKPSRKLVEQIVSKIKEYRETEQWQKEAIFIPHPSTWLNEGRWEDVIEQESQNTGKTKLYPLPGKTCSKPECKMPAVYKSTGGDYDFWYCTDHMPKSVKEEYA